MLFDSSLHVHFLVWQSSYDASLSQWSCDPFHLTNVENTWMENKSCTQHLACLLDHFCWWPRWLCSDCQTLHCLLNSSFHIPKMCCPHSSHNWVWDSTSFCLCAGSSLQSPFSSCSRRIVFRCRPAYWPHCSQCSQCSLEQNPGLFLHGSHLLFLVNRDAIWYAKLWHVLSLLDAETSTALPGSSQGQMPVRNTLTSRIFSSGPMHPPTGRELSTSPPS